MNEGFKIVGMGAGAWGIWGVALKAGVATATFVV
jgi:hypothetical protein